MPSQGFEQLMERAVSDEAFAGRLRTDLEAVLTEYNLTDEEKQALLSRDPVQMQALGVDPRISKGFSIG